MRLRSTIIALVLVAELPLAGCTKTSDGTIQVAGFNRLSDFPTLRNLSALPRLLPRRREPAGQLPPASAFPPPPPVATTTVAAATPVQPRRPARAAQQGRRRPAGAAAVKARAGQPGVIPAAAGDAPLPAAAKSEAAPTAGQPPAAAPKIIVCKDPVLQQGRYVVTCD